MYWTNMFPDCVYVKTVSYFPCIPLQDHHLFGEQWRWNPVNINKHALPLVIRVTLWQGLPPLQADFLTYKVKELNQIMFKGFSCLFTVTLQWWHGACIIYSVGGHGLVCHLFLLRKGNEMILIGNRKRMQKGSLLFTTWYVYSHQNHKGNR